MHEFSVMSELVNVVRGEVERRNITRINEVVLAVGELAFLGSEQMRFSYGVLVENDEVMKDSKLTIRDVPASVKCGNCGYSGGVDYLATEDDHFRMPVIKCPECGGSVEIVSGKECQIMNLVAEIDDEHKLT